MKLGLLTDIHEDNERLRAALDHFQLEEVDQVVLIGDLFQVGEQIEETCRMLAEVGAIGVWGNHDFGLCRDPSDQALRKYSGPVLEFMSTLQPRLVLEDCHFMHVEPWLDPEEITDLWYFDGPPVKRLDRIFDAVDHQLLFAGHYHHWRLITRDGVVDWKGKTPVQLTNDRYFIVIGALCQGRYAIFDTESRDLFPMNLAG